MKREKRQPPRKRVAPHEFELEGHIVEAKGFDSSGNFWLKDGRCFRVTPLQIPPGEFRSLRIRGISKLTRTDGEWLLDGIPLKAQWSDFGRPPTSIDREIKRKERVLKAWNLAGLLGVDFPGVGQKLEPEILKRVVGVAWVEERFTSYPAYLSRQTTQGTENSDDETAETPKANAYEPILLSEFHEIVGNVKQKTGKLLAKISADFSVAEIRCNGPTPEIVPITDELAALIEALIHSGNGLRHSELAQILKIRQPEKRLESQAAEKLIGAGLLGTPKTGREKAYWAKMEVREVLKKSS